MRNTHGVPTFVGASREGVRPGKLLPKQLATGEHFTSLKTCEMFRLEQAWVHQGAALRRVVLYGNSKRVALIRRVRSRESVAK